MSLTTDKHHDLPLESPASMDFSLELEGHLEDHEELNTANLDTDVLTSLIIQLRTNLAQVTQERDVLVTALAVSEARTSDLRDEKNRADRLENELALAKKKHQDDEDAIAMLRAKVEESRRGLMRLQTESKRMSGHYSIPSSMPLHTSSPHATTFDLNQPRTPGFTSLPNKRASSGFVIGAPPKGKHIHRRQSSASESGIAHELAGSPPQGDVPPSAGRTSPPNTSKRYSLLRSSPPQESFLQQQAINAEVEALRTELASIRLELAEAKHEVSEANEAREASELCVKALRTFIAENSVGVTAPYTNTVPLKLPPLPTDKLNEPEEPAPPKKAGWALWGRSASVSEPAPPAAATSFVSSWTRAAPPPPSQPVERTAPQPPAPAPQQSFVRKFGFFGGGGASKCETASVNPPTPSMCSETATISSVASISEPVSPAGLQTVEIPLVDGEDERAIHTIMEKEQGNTTPRAVGVAV